MIWQYFPIGFRFPVPDFSETTRRDCWTITLDALKRANATGVTLYDAQQTFDPATGGPVYLCIACFYGIKQARACAKRFYAMDDLMVRLCMHQPFMQANSLESFGPYALLGKTEEDGSFSFTEAGQNVLENLPSNALCAKAGTRLLLVFDSREDGAQDDARTLAILASQHGFAVSRTLIADGGCGTVRALVTGRNGRFETVSLTMPDGTRKTELIGILPGSIAVLEAHGRDAAGIGLLIGKALDLGYRRIWVGANGCIDPQNALCALETLGVGYFDAADAPVHPDAQQRDGIAKTDRSTLDARLGECELKLLYDGEPDALCDALGSIGFAHMNGAETVLNAAGLGTAVRKADYIVLFAHRNGFAAKAALSECELHKTPTCLLCEQPVDRNRLMREHAILRGVVVWNKEDASALTDTFTEQVLPAAGKDVAKAERI